MISKKLFGKLDDGKEVYIYTITNRNDTQASFISYGATWQSMIVKDKNGCKRDVLIGFDDLKGHVERSDYQGNIVGRYANRISGGSFTINGKKINITKNEKNMTCLHGGGNFSKAVWDAQEISDNALKFSLVSPDGEDGFPGEFKTSVTYTLSDEDELSIDYSAVCTEDTPINMTNHAYFNLGGYERANVLSQEILIRASHFTPITADSIPTGEIRDVTNTAFDFREMKSIERDHMWDDEQLNNNRHGYDHNFCLDHESDLPDAEAYDAESGIYMQMRTTLPGVQLYTGNFLDDVLGKGNTKMGRYAGFCLETQSYPDTPNRPEFPSCNYAAGEEYKSSTSFKFIVK